MFIACVKRFHFRIFFLSAVSAAVIVASAFSAPAAQLAVMTTPANGATLTQSTVTFAWQPGDNAREYWLWAGTKKDKFDIFSGSAGLNTSIHISNIPVSGQPLYIRLYTKVDNYNWRFNEYVYQTQGSAPAPAPGAMVSPPDNSLITDENIRFEWNSGHGVQNFWLFIGSTPGGTQYYYQSQGLNTSVTVSNIPVRGQKIYVRLWSLLATGWAYKDYQYQADGGLPELPKIQAPENGTTILSSTVTFTWTTAPIVDKHFLFVGSTPGGFQYYFADEGKNTARTVNTLQLNGSPVYVRLWSLINGTWEYVDTVYQTPSSVIYSEDLCVGGVSSASSCLQGCGSVYSHTKVFDNVFNVHDGWVSNNTRNGWIEYQFNEPKIIAKYNINPRAEANGNPRDWNFEAYDEAAQTWVVLDNRSGISWTPPKTQEFTFSNLTPYTRYRLNIFANNGHSEVGFTEMEMMRIDVPFKPKAVTNLQTETGNQSVALKWSKPDENGAVITGYTVEYGTVASGVFNSTFVDDASPGAVITGLSNDIEYQFRVYAQNIKGISSASNIVTAAPKASVNVNTDITSNTTWQKFKSPYIINSDIRIYPQATLTIEAGVEIKFNGHYKWFVDGQINSQGTENNKVIFTSNQENPSAGDWESIQLNGTEKVIENITVEYSQSGIFVEPGISATIRNSLFRNNVQGIHFGNQPEIKISNNIIVNNQDGIYADCNRGDICNYGIHNNFIFNNSRHNFYVAGNGDAAVINAQMNWWGSTDVLTIENTIFDQLDDSTRALVDFEPFLVAGPDDLINITDNDVIPRFFDPERNGATMIVYALDQEADVTIKIFDQATKNVVRTLVDQQPRTAGSYAEIWDGTDDNNEKLDTGIFTYSIDARGTEGRAGRYEPEFYDTIIPVISDVTVSPADIFSPFTGERLEVHYDLDRPALVTLKLGAIPIMTRQPRNTGSHIDFWNGRDASGTFVSTPEASSTLRAELAALPDNSIVIQNDQSTLDITTLNANPYLLHPLYNENTTITYAISQAAQVTVNIVSPDGQNVLAVLESNSSKPAGTYTIPWDGRRPADNTVVDEGDCRIRVSAVDTHGRIITREGNIRIQF